MIEYLTHDYTTQQAMLILERFCLCVSSLLGQGLVLNVGSCMYFILVHSMGKTNKATPLTLCAPVSPQLPE